jgi:hypothetical protein
MPRAYTCANGDSIARFRPFRRQRTTWIAVTRILAAITRTPRPSPQAVILGVLVLATVLMPVSYRAGSDSAHPHTVFQGVIDLLSGHPHHHTVEPVNSAPASALFSPLPTSLLLAVSHVDRVATPAEPDIPELLGLSVPISALAAIQELRLLLLALLSSVVIGRIWTAHRSLVAIPSPVESPPPRHAA